MAKRLVVLATMLAAMLALAAPAALAQEAAQQQYSPEGLPAAEEFSGSGVIESIDGIPGGYGLLLPSGEGLYLEGGFDFESFVGQNVDVSGVVNTGSDGARILTVEQIEPEEGVRGEEISVTGVVEEQGEKADGTVFYGLIDEATGQGYALEGDFDFASFVGQRVAATGVYEPGGGMSVLRVSGIEPAAGGRGGTTTGGGTTTIGGGSTIGGTTMGETTAAGQYEDGGTPEQAGIDLNDDGAVNEADGEFAVQTSEGGVSSAPDEGALPGTGGLVLPVAGLAGALLVVAGLLFRKNRQAR